MCVIDAGEQVQCGGIALDDVKAKASAEHGPQIECLQAVSLEVSPHKGKQPRSDVTVVANPTLFSIRCRAGDCPRSVIGCVDRIGVQAELVVKSFSIGSEGQGKVLGFAVPAG